MTTSQSERRQRRVQRIVENLVAAQALPVRSDDAGVISIQLPLDVKNTQEIPWVISFDKQVAADRAAEFVSFVNPRFQQILQGIGDGPAWCLNKVRPLENVNLPQGALLQTRFSFYIQYSTHGETREELWHTRIGELPDGLTSDAFDPKAKMPPQSTKHYEDAKLALDAHIAQRLEAFRPLAQAKLEGERSRLAQFQPRLHGATTKADYESETFYHEAVQRHLQTLEQKYEITVRPRLVAMEVFVLEDVA